jgi:hypothetical protein
MPRPPIGWRKYLRWRGVVDARAERRRARRAVGGEVARFTFEPDVVLARLSPGELHLACCPDTVIVDHDGLGPGPLLIQHHRQVHGLPVAWHTDTPANDAPEPDRPATGDRESNVGG